MCRDPTQQVVPAATAERALGFVLPLNLEPPRHLVRVHLGAGARGGPTRREVSSLLFHVRRIGDGLCVTWRAFGYLFEGSWRHFDTI